MRFRPPVLDHRSATLLVQSATSHVVLVRAIALASLPTLSLVRSLSHPSFVTAIVLRARLRRENRLALLALLPRHGIDSVLYVVHAARVVNGIMFRNFIFMNGPATSTDAF